MIKLQDKLYTSTEVASILGVSLRSVYRYLEENRLTAEVKTATGRHRFTKQDILNFLYPGGDQELDDRTSQEAPASNRRYVETPRREEFKPEERYESRSQETSQEDSVDWLSKFRAAAEKFKTTEDVNDTYEESAPVHVDREPIQQETYTKARKDEDFETIGFSGYSAEAAVEKDNTLFYYRSSLGGLKDIAQNIDKHSRESQLDYAFTLNAGLSLYKPIKPFSLLHSYVRSVDQQYFEKLLMLSPSDKENAQLCLMLSDDDKVYATREELHGLYVVSKSVLLKDIEKLGSDELKGDAESIL